LAGAIGMLANFGLFFGNSRDNPLGPIGILLVSILAPIAALLVQMGISRSREYAADRGGAEISGAPLSLASALAKIERRAGQTRNFAAEANPATAHLFIVNPLHGGLAGLFATHPSTAERIRRLQAMTGAPAATARAAAPPRPDRRDPRRLPGATVAGAGQRDRGPAAARHRPAAVPAGAGPCRRRHHRRAGRPPRRRGRLQGAGQRRAAAGRPRARGAA